MEKSVHFDGLRGVACLLVLVPHCRYFGFYIHEFVSFGRFAQFGLFLFFFLSAYLISKSIFTEVDRTPIEKWGGYTLRRLFRIVPLYYAVLLIDYTLLHFYFGAAGAHDVQSLWRHIIFEEGRSALWTMPVEIRFYFLLIPLMLICFYALKLPIFWRRVFFACAGILSFTWLAYIFFLDRTSTIATWGVHQYAPFFVFGTVWAAIQLAYTDWLDRIPNLVWSIVGILAGLFFLLQNPLWWQAISPYNVWTYDPSDINALTFDVFLSWRMYGMVIVVLAMFVVLERPKNWLTAVLSTKPIVSVGRYSYGIYLIHMPIIFLVKDHITTQPQAGFMLVVCLAIISGIFLYRFVELPGIQWGKAARSALFGKRQFRTQRTDPSCDANRSHPRMP